MTGSERGALTVAGQWRTFTAFPCILAIAVVSGAAASGCGSDVMESTSMASTFIAGKGFEVKSGISSVSRPKMRGKKAGCSRGLDRRTEW